MTAVLVGRTLVAPAGGYTARCDLCGWQLRYNVPRRSQAFTGLLVHAGEVHP